MNFPLIKHINDILPYIEHKDEFIIGHKDNYMYVDYVATRPNPFIDDEGNLCPYSMECRGIKFNMDGTILARPFHKFFNIGEPNGYDWEYLDTNPDYHIYEKLDGSMVHSAILDGKMRLMTRKGITDVSLLAESYLPSSIYQFALKWALQGYKEYNPDKDSNPNIQKGFGYTVIFEFTSHDNRIVIKYDTPQFTLIGIRHNETGEYIHFKDLQLDDILDIGIEIPVEYNTVSDVKGWTDREGVVIVWPNGSRAKLKADDYVLKHKTKEGLLFDKDVIRLVLEDKVDDVIPLLHKDEVDKLTSYASELILAIRDIERSVYDLCYHYAELSQKDFALEVKYRTSFTPLYRTLMFNQRNRGECDLKELILQKYLTSQTKVDTLYKELNIPRKSW
jgi:RNA ligase